MENGPTEEQLDEADRYFAENPGVWIEYGDEPPAETEQA